METDLNDYILTSTSSTTSHSTPVMTITPTTSFDRITSDLQSILSGNHSPPFTFDESVLSSSNPEQWTDGDVLVELDNLSMLCQICDGLPKLPEQQRLAQQQQQKLKINTSQQIKKQLQTRKKSIGELILTQSSTCEQSSPFELTFGDLLTFWQLYDQLYIEQFKYNQSYSTTIIDRGVQNLSILEFDFRVPSSLKCLNPNEQDKIPQELTFAEQTVDMNSLKSCSLTKFSTPTSDEMLDFDSVVWPTPSSTTSSLLPCTTSSSAIQSTSNLIDTTTYITNINGILENLKAGLLISTEYPSLASHVPDSFDYLFNRDPQTMSTHDLLAETLPLLPPPPQQQQQPRSSLTNNRLITISTINNIEIPSILIDNIIHIRLVDLSKHLLNNLQLSLIKHYAKQCNCLIIQCQEFLRDFLIRNNRQASTSRSCFCLTFDDCKKIYQELTQYLPSLLNPMKQQQNEMIVHNKRKHSQTSWVLEAVKPLKKRLKQQQDIVFHLIHDHDYLAEHNMHHLMINNNMKRKASKTISKSILSGIEQLPLIKKITTLPTETILENTTFVTEAVSSPLTIISTSDIVETNDEDIIELASPLVTSPLPKLPSKIDIMLLKLKDYFQSLATTETTLLSKTTTSTMVQFNLTVKNLHLFDSYKADMLLFMVNSPLLIISQTYLEYILFYLNKRQSSQILPWNIVEWYHLDTCKT